jgi:hypothetical protein
MEKHGETWRKMEKNGDRKRKWGTKWTEKGKIG